MIDSIEKVMAIVRRVGSGVLASRDLRVLIAIDVANASNTAPWSRIGRALVQKRVNHTFLKLSEITLTTDGF